MKKTTCICLGFIILLISICSSGCGSRPIDTETLQPSISAEPIKKYIIGMSQPNFSDTWRSTFNDELREAVKKYPEFELVIMNGQRDNNKQISDIKGLIDKNVDVLMISPNEALPLTDIINRAYKTGIPVILIDRKTESDCYTQYIGCDNETIGRMAGEWVLNKLGEHGGNVVEIMGAIGTSAQIERHNGFLEAISKNPLIKLIDSQPADWMQDKAISVMETMLDKYKKIDAVYAHNDFSALGAYSAAEKADRQNEMYFIGIDALSTPDGGLKGIMDGKLDVTYLYPTGAKEAIESCYELLVEHKKLNKHISLQTVQITSENVQYFYKNTT